MGLRVNIAIFTLGLLTIVGGVRAVSEEHRRSPEFLRSKYQDLNQRAFENKLPPVRIEWADLTAYNYLGETYRESDGTFVVLVDWRTNLRDEVLQDTVFHEMCHIATWRQEDDPHGSAFLSCVAENQGKALQDRSMKAR
jgi:predicted SprT family Zn-dependent metalloprotease